MTTVTITNPIEAFLEVATSAVGQRESGKNRGTFPSFANWFYSGGDMRPFPSGLDRAPWCATGANLIGRLALGAGWPIPRHPSYSDVDKMVAWARSKKVWYDVPEIGDLVAVQGKNGDWVHVGIVLWIDDRGFVSTIECNSNNDGSRDGKEVVKHKRSQGVGLGYIRWVEAL